ncbi:hypothetical protein D3C81_1816990 [compost metagenome]
MISSCRKVGASDGGADTTPPNWVMPRPMAAKVMARMPIITAPVMRRASRPTIRKKPRMARIGSGLVRSPRPTRVAGLATTMAASFSAISARNRPMPAAIAERSSRGMLLMIHSRMRKIEIRKNMHAERNTAPSATCQVWPMCRTTV